MVRGAWVLAVLAAGLLVASIPVAGKSALTYPITVRAGDLTGGGAEDAVGWLELRDGAASITFQPQSGSMQVWVQREQCVNRDRATCLQPSVDTRRVTFEPGSEVTIHARDSGRYSAGLHVRDGTLALQVPEGTLGAPVNGKTLQIANVPGGPQDHQRFTSVHGVPLGTTAATFSAEGSITLVLWNGVLEYVDSSGADGAVVTGESWTGTGVNSFREVALVKVNAVVGLVGSWSGAVTSYLPPPFALAGDLEYGGQSIEGASLLVTGATADGLVAEPAAPPAAVPPEDEDDLPTGTIVAGVSAFGVALAGLAAYYWPRFSWGLTILALPMYSRIEKSELLDHNVRENLYELIQHEPGIHAHALAERAGIGWGTTVYHLRLLERNRMVTSERAGRYRRFFPAAGFLARKREVLSVLQNDTTNNIARLILRKPGMNQKAICEELSISPSLANWHLNRLLESELCRRERHGRTVHYFPGEAWDEIGREVAG